MSSFFKSDFLDTFNAGAALGPVNQTKMERIWNKHKQINTTLKPKIIVGMSGGVDSSVALMLLKERGFDPIGVSLKYAVWKDKKNILKENVCCSQESFDRARNICQKFDVPYHIVDFSNEFERGVMGYFAKLLKKQQTPNPCLVCNRDLKFKKLFDFARENGINYVATGHYARVRQSKKSKLYQLLRAKDKVKDQSYFLCLLNQRQLKRLVFPLGDYLKDEVYQIAKNHGFNFYLKTKQSQDLCFVSAKSMPFYLAKEIGKKPGPIQDLQGNILGQHQGLHFYTIGQRKRLNLPQGPWWVVGFDRKKNTLMVTQDSNSPELFKKTVLVANLHFISGQKNKKTILVQAKIRYHQVLAPAKLKPPQNKTSELIFKQPQRAVTAGQWAVVYQKDVCLGGGLIK